MKTYSLSIFCALILSILLSAHSGGLQAAPISFKDAALLHPANVSAIQKIGYGCGWDYPCAPRPYFGRRHHHQPENVYIRNNYGTVNVYVNRWGRERWHHRSWETQRCCANGEYTRSEAPVESTRCDRNPCEPECDTWCWFRRFKRGYCGHGCEVYREKVRFEKGERTYEYPRPVYYRDVPPAYRPYDEEDAPVRYSRPNDGETYERRPFDGPRYPPHCSGEDC